MFSYLSCSPHLIHPVPLILSILFPSSYPSCSPHLIHPVLLIFSILFPSSYPSCSPHLTHPVPIILSILFSSSYPSCFPHLTHPVPIILSIMFPTSYPSLIHPVPIILYIVFLPFSQSYKMIEPGIARSNISPCSIILNSVHLISIILFLLLFWSCIRSPEFCSHVLLIFSFR